MKTNYNTLLAGYDMRGLIETQGSIILAACYIIEKHNNLWRFPPFVQELVLVICKREGYIVPKVFAE